MKRKTTYDTAKAAAWDAGNRSMHKRLAEDPGGPKRWTRDDYNAAVDEIDRLWWESGDRGFGET